MRTTPAGVEYLRTPDTCFDGLPDWPYKARYVDIDGLRQAYVDEGPADADPIVLLHGEPSWSYLYRHMIRDLVADGHRVIAMDHLGMGRSDKPVDPGYYTFDVHAKRLSRFLDDRQIQHATLFAQDWGSVTGLWEASVRPDRFDRIIIGNGGMPQSPQPFEPAPGDDPGVTAFGTLLRSVPAQQVPFFDKDGKPLLPQAPAGPAPDGQARPVPPTAGGSATTLFSQWAGYAYHDETFRPSVMLEALTYRDLDPAEEAAYDAPYPDRRYMAAPRSFPSLLNDLVGRTAARRTALTGYDKPFLTLFGGNDPGLSGEADDQQWMKTRIAGAAGQPHHRYPDASHFLQEDKGADLARRVHEFVTKPTS